MLGPLSPNDGFLHLCVSIKHHINSGFSSLFGGRGSLTVKGTTDTNWKLFKWEKCMDSEWLRMAYTAFEWFEEQFERMNKFLKRIGNSFKTDE